MYYLRRIVQNLIYITLCDIIGYCVAVLVFGSLVGSWVVIVIPNFTFFSSFYLGMMLLGVGSIIYVGKEEKKVKFVI